MNLNLVFELDKQRMHIPSYKYEQEKRKNKSLFEFNMKVLQIISIIIISTLSNPIDGSKTYVAIDGNDKDYQGGVSESDQLFGVFIQWNSDKIRNICVFWKPFENMTTGSKNGFLFQAQVFSKMMIIHFQINLVKQLYLDHNNEFVISFDFFHV